MAESKSFTAKTTDSNDAVMQLLTKYPNAEILDISLDVYGTQTFISYRLRVDAKEKWDRRFLAMAELVSTWSKDPSTKCGAVIVRPDRTVVSLGFNGFPRGCRDEQANYENREEKYQRVIHAEVNAILQAHADVRDCTLYTWPPGLAPSCDRCATVVIQAGIKRIVHVAADNEFTRRWSPERALSLYEEAGVEVVKYEP